MTDFALSGLTLASEGDAGAVYMPTASIPASQQKVKNVVADPALGMPQ